MINLLQVKQFLFYFISFIFFIKLILNFWLIVFISQVILSENLLNKKKNDAAQKKIKKSHIAKMPQSCSQF